LYRGIDEFKNGYQPRTNVVKDERGDLFADSHSIMAKWRNSFSQLLHVHGFNDVRQTEIHTAEPLMPEPSAFEIELAVEKLKSRISPAVDQILGELIRARGRTFRYEVHKLINSIWNEEELSEDLKESVIVPICRKYDKQVCSNYRGISLVSNTYKMLFNNLLSRLSPYAEKITGVYTCEFRRNLSTIDLIFCIRQILQKEWE